MARLWIVALAATLGCAQSATRRGLDLTPCAVDALAEEAQCGVLDVLEDDANGNGRRIALHVAVLPAQAAAPAPDPVFVFAGGPGQGARSYAAFFSRTFRAIRHERDLVFIDFRGTGDSGPLRCRNLRDDEAEPLLWRLTTSDVAACLSALEGDVRFTRTMPSSPTWSAFVPASATTTSTSGAAHTERARHCSMRSNILSACGP